MSKTLYSIFLGLLLTTTTAAFAQDTTTETSPATDAPAADSTPDAAADLNMGQPVGPDGTPLPQVGQPYIAEESGDWALRCLKAPEGQADPCQLYQLLLDKDGNAVAEISMFPLPPGNRAAAGATVVVPLETLLTEQLTLTVDSAAARQYPFTFCNPAGCVARIGFTAEEVTQFKRGNKATLRMVPAAAPDQEVLLDMSLKGFTAGFDNTVTAPQQ